MFLTTLQGRSVLFSATLTYVVVSAASLPHANATDELPPENENVRTHQSDEVKRAGGTILLRQGFLEEFQRNRQSLSAEQRDGEAVILKLDALLTPEKRVQLESTGLILEEYLGDTTYLFATSADRTLVATLEEGVLPQDTLGERLLPKSKILPAVYQKVEIPEELSAKLSLEEIKPTLTVVFLSIVGPEKAQKALKGIGVAITEQLSPHAFVVEGGPDEAKKIAELPSVKTVDRGPLPFLPLNSTVREPVRTNEVQGFTLPNKTPSYIGVTGKGIRIAIADTGVDENHHDFDDLINGDGGAAVNSRVYNPQEGYWGWPMDHGTHVASTAGGNGFNSQGSGYSPFSLRGHAPEAMIGDYPYMYSKNEHYHDAIVRDRSDLSNHSYVQSINGYGTNAQGLDSIVRGNAPYNGVAIPSRPQVWAAGNNGDRERYDNEKGYYAVFTSAKNTISVGSIDSRDNRLSAFSSLGPTFDGRIKPDLVAPGCRDSISNAKILAAKRESQNYTRMCGTSMAAPVVSGIIALMMEKYNKANPGLSAAELYPSTYKAILINTATDLIKTEPYKDREFNNPDTKSPVIYHAGPDFATGYGLVNAEAAVNAISNRTQWKQEEVKRTGQVDSYTIAVPADTTELRVTLAWDDEPASPHLPITQTKLVNDLDLELIAPNETETIIQPWTLDPLPITDNPGDGGPDPIINKNIVAAHRGVDRRNNVEMVSAQGPKNGNWTVRVRAFMLPNANSQSYSLAASLAFFSAPKTTSSTETTSSEISPWNANSTYTGGDRVLWEGIIYEARWWTKNNRPPHHSWKVISNINGTIAAWQPNVEYKTDEEVLYEGHIYRAKWSRQNQSPLNNGLVQEGWELVR